VRRVRDPRDESIGFDGFDYAADTAVIEQYPFADAHRGKDGAERARDLCGSGLSVMPG
jgi:hypothetical protein